MKCHTFPFQKTERGVAPFSLPFLPLVHEERKLNRLLLCLDLLKELLQGVFVALREFEGRSREGFEVNRQIVESIEGSVTFHGINDSRKYDI